MRRRHPLVLLVFVSPLTSLCLSISTSSRVDRKETTGRLRMLENGGGQHVVSLEEKPTTVRRERRSFLATLILGGFSPLFLEPSVAVGDDKQVMGTRNRRVGGLANKIRNIGRVMDELQRDLMQERWDLVESYPAQLRSFVPVLTTYTDSAFPTDAPTDKGLRVALRYEVGRFYASLERFRGAASRRALDESYLAFAEMSLHFDRYLRVGGLYTYYDDTISNEPYFKGLPLETLVYADQKKDPPLVRDLVVLIKGPDKGKTGIVIGMYPDNSNRSVVKLDRYRSMREIRVVDNSWVAKRLGEQDPDDVFLIPRKGGN